MFIPYLVNRFIFTLYYLLFKNLLYIPRGLIRSAAVSDLPADVPLSAYCTKNPLPVRPDFVKHSDLTDVPPPVYDGLTNKPAPATAAEKKEEKQCISTE